MTTENDDAMKAVDSLLADAAQNTPELPPDLAARVLADADAVQAQRYAPPDRASQPGFLAGLRSVLPGGWGAAGGLVAATCAGFWIGISPPSVLPDPGGALFGTATVTDWDGPVDVAGFGWVVEEE